MCTPRARGSRRARSAAGTPTSAARVARGHRAPLLPADATGRARAPRACGAPRRGRLPALRGAEVRRPLGRRGAALLAHPLLPRLHRAVRPPVAGRPARGGVREKDEKDENSVALGVAVCVSFLN
eukprot:scaffold172891_cov38-Tisochrysis_lutea.AAC.1